jgi:hypothetical protein
MAGTSPHFKTQLPSIFMNILTLITRILEVMD